jgi:2-iminobutanoate/2-iminopropanoate deaminase
MAVNKSRGADMPEKEIIVSQKAPKALGPYNVANRFHHLVFCSGQLGLDPETNELVPGGIKAETRLLARLFR